MDNNEKEALSETELSENDLDQVSGGGMLWTGYCFRCGADVPFAEGSWGGLKYYGKRVCRKCFDHFNEIERRTGKPAI